MVGIRCVVDTNVLISRLLLPHRVVCTAVRKDYRFASSRNACSVLGTCSSGLIDEYA